MEICEGYNILDISDATVKRIIIEKPDHTIISENATFLTDGSDGIIYYRTVAGDLSLAGDYGVQGYIETQNFKGYSSPTSFTVYENLPDWNP